MISRQAWKNGLCTALLVGAFSSQALAADLFVIGPLSPVAPGTTVSVEVFLTGITDLYAYQFDLSFNPAVLQATSVTEGAFLATGGATVFNGGTINNTLGTISFVADTLLGPVPGVSGNGILARFNFNAAGVGTSPITFSNTPATLVFLDSSLGDLSVQLQNGAVQVVPEPASMLLLGLGLAGVLALRRHRA